jgi:hypothetical protein
MVAILCGIADVRTTRPCSETLPATRRAIAQKSMQRPFFSQSPYRVGSKAGRSTGAWSDAGLAGTAAGSAGTEAGFDSAGEVVSDMVL